MQIEPPESLFADHYARGEAQVVWTTLVADLETAVSAFLKLGGGKAMSFLLESVEGGAVRGRYSIIGIEPDLIWRANGAKAEINRSARTKADAFVACTEPPLQALRALISESRIELPSSLPPMAAGVFGYLGYDIVRRMEDLSAPNPDPIGVPDAVLVRPTIIVVFDAVRDSITIVTPVRPERTVDAKAALAHAIERLGRVVESLDRPLDKSLSERDTGPIEEGCDCYACRTFTRGAIRHYFFASEMLGPVLVSVHNIRFYQRFMADLRRAIGQGRFGEFLRSDPRCSMAPPPMSTGGEGIAPSVSAPPHPSE